MSKKIHRAAMNTIILPLSLFLLTIMFANIVEATNYTTTGFNDNLTISVNDSYGRVTGLNVDVLSVNFCPTVTTGGFYLRDNTAEANGLPADVTNELLCGDFGSDLTECEACIGESYPWIPAQFGGITTVACDTINPTARIQVGQDQRSSGVIYQDITEFISVTPVEHELYYLSFKIATECGWRSSTHPWDWDPEKHATHRVVAYVEWYDDDAINPTTAVWKKSDTAIAITSLEAFNTSIEMMPFCLRTYRPINASQARIKFVVEGFMPNDNVVPTNPNFVLLDDVAFFKAPDAKQLVGAWSSSPATLTYEGGGTNPNLSMTLSVVPHDTYIQFDGTLQNDDQQKTRSLDFGFSLPIFSGFGQQVVWHDDNHVSMGVADDALEQTIPFRMVGPADMRSISSTDFVFPDGAKQWVEKTFRGRGLNISAYPFSAISITKSGTTRGLSYGDNLTQGYPQISHFGYRVEAPGTVSSNFVGRYYVEFNVGLLEGDNDPMSDEDTGRFSFILYRSDLPQWTITQAFRESAEKYETSIYPDFFTRPANCDDDWLFGGGLFSGIMAATSGYNYRPNDFGFRYIRRVNEDTPSGNTDLINQINYWRYALSAKDADVLVYDHPWFAQFVNGRYGSPDQDSVNVYATQATRIANYQPADTIWRDLYFAKRDNKLMLPGLTSPLNLLTRDVFKTDDPQQAKYFFPALLANQPIGQADLLELETGDLNSPDSGYITDAYDDVSKLSTKGLAGFFYDNVFVGEKKGPQLDVLSEATPPVSRTRQEAFVAAGGTLTYSLSHLKPAISQIPLNANLMKTARSMLDSIDGSSQYVTVQLSEVLSAGNGGREPVRT